MTLFYINLIVFFIFLLSYKLEPRRLLNGFLFNVLLVITSFSFVYLALQIPNLFILCLLLLLLLNILFFLLFGIYILIIALLINAKIVMRRERKTFANLLTLFVALGLITLIGCIFICLIYPLPRKLLIFLSGFGLVGFYYLCNLLSFLSISFLFWIRKPTYHDDYLIVLGSGLIKNEVPPLLASRIDKAIQIYHTQKTRSKPPILLFSGGQGPNEDIPEAIAMQQYAIRHHIPLEHTLVETNSKNTLQNLKFSKQIMDQNHPNGYQATFVTNNYHTFRASLYAKAIGLKTTGIGSKTAPYFLPNAMIREYMALLILNKKRHLIITVLFLIFGLLLIFFIWSKSILLITNDLKQKKPPLHHQNNLVTKIISVSQQPHHINRPPNSVLSISSIRNPKKQLKIIHPVDFFMTPSTTKTIYINYTNTK